MLSCGHLHNATSHAAGGKYRPGPLPLAAVRSTERQDYVTWTGTDTVFGEHVLEQLRTGEQAPGDGRVTLVDNTLCRQAT